MKTQTTVSPQRSGLAPAAAALFLGVCGTCPVLRAADPDPVVRDWQRIVVPPVEEAAAKFADPPAEYGLTMWWFWNGDMTPEAIRRDLQDLRAHNVRCVMLWCYNGLTNLEYLSPAWFERVAFAVREAGQAGIRVWIADEGCYPSGFVGGKVSRERPHQRMQVLVPRQTAAGQVEVVPEYRTSATRYIHTPGFRKDTSCSLFDALDPAATRDFLNDVHEQYRRCIGEEFGRTVLGFMGDEPSFPGVPFTPGIFEEFQRRKGYDIQPQLAKLFSKQAAGEDWRIRADYWEVWSDRYRDSFFKPQADWCAQYGLEFQMHICGEEDLKTLVALNGDYFRCMQPVQVPGVDAIWRQIWPGQTADYAKLASSVAHVWGRPRCFSEGYAVYGRGLSVEQAKWVLDHHLVRGINLFETMSYLSSRAEFRPYFCPPDLNLSPQWPEFSRLFAYANRMSWLLSMGKPAASIALYHPVTSAWLGDHSANEAALAIARKLLENQLDFDFIDEQALQTALEVRAGTLVNRSGQGYGVVLVPPVKVISEHALKRLEEFARSGGTVLFAGRWPELVARTSFREAVPGPALLPWARLVPAQALPEIAPELFRHTGLSLERSPGGGNCPEVKQMQRRLANGELYFLFNESDRPVALSVTLEGQGLPEFWDAETGKRTRPTVGKREKDHVRLWLTLEPYETRVIVLGPEGKLPPDPRPTATAGAQSFSIEGEWTLDLAGGKRQGPLKTWADWGEPGFSGTARYTKVFDVPASVAAGQELRWIDLGEVRYSARVRLNGRDLGSRAWRPFRWPVNGALRPGANTLEVEVTNTAANELAGDPARLEEIKAKGWLANSYINRYLAFDQEMVPSGLLGPVSLLQ